MSGPSQFYMASLFRVRDFWADDVWGGGHLEGFKKGPPRESINFKHLQTVWSQLTAMLMQ